MASVCLLFLFFESQRRKGGGNLEDDSKRGREEGRKVLVQKVLSC